MRWLSCARSALPSAIFRLSYSSRLPRSRVAAVAAAALAFAIATSTVLPAVAADKAGSQSADTTTKPVALDAIVADILDRNPEINFYKAEIAAARGEAQTDAASPDQASGAGGRDSVNGNALAGEALAWSVSVARVFEWPGRMPLRKAIANQDIALAEVGLAQFKAALAARARIAAFGLLAAQQKSAAAREVADRFRALSRILVQRDPAGITPQLEARIIEATEVSMLRRASEAAMAEQAAMLELNQLRGLPWADTLRVAPVDLTFTPPPSMDTLLAAAQTNNFEIMMRRAELAQQGFRTPATGNAQYPAASGGQSVSPERATERERPMSVDVPRPLWAGSDENAQTTAARQQQADTSMYVTQRNVERQIVERAAAYRTKVTEIRKWRMEAVAEFRKAADLADRHYRLGAVPIATYVELQRQYLDAADALLEAKREAFEAAQHLEVLTGLEVKAVHTAVDSRPSSRTGETARKPATR